MRRFGLFYSALFIFLMSGIVFAQEANEVENLLANGGFEDGIPDPWSMYGGATMEVVGEVKNPAVDEDVIEGESCLHIEVFGKGDNFWDIGLQHAGHTFEAGKVYTLSAYIKSADGAVQINFKPELAADPWTGYGSRSFVVTEEWKEYQITTPPMPNDVNPATITFHIGYDAAEFWMDDVKFYEGKPDVDPGEASIELENGGFESGVTTPWTMYGDSSIEVARQLKGAFFPDSPIEGKYALHVTVNDIGANFWDVGLQNAGHVFEAGKEYTLAAFLKSKEGPLEINFKPELAADPWTGFGSQQFTMTDEWEEYYITTPPMPEDIDPASLTFHIGFTKGEFWMDGVRFYEGEYEEPDFSTPKSVRPQGKLASTWGKTKIN